MTLSHRMEVYTNDLLKRDLLGAARSPADRIEGSNCYRAQLHQSIRKIRLIVLDRDRLAFIEVRYRSRSNFGSALASVSPVKQQKVLMTPQMFLASHGNYCTRYCRFDIIAFDGPRGSVSTQWLKGAFGLAEHPNYE